MDVDEALQRAAVRYPDLYLAATKGAVTFQHLLQVRGVRRRDAQIDRELGRALEPVIRTRFERDNGKILGDYWGNRIFGGCLLTDQDVVHMGMNVDLADVVVLQTKVEQLCRDAQATFGSPRLASQRREAGQALFSIASRLVATAEILVLAVPANVQAAAGLLAHRREAVAAMNSEWGLARRRIQVLIQRQARFDYFLGVLIGAPIALGLFAVIGALATAHWQQEIAVPAFLAATLAGVIGGVISVIQRMSSGQLVLDYTASPGQKRLLGAMRPLVAGTFAAVIQFGLLGGLLTMQGNQPPESTPATFAFFALVGFAAGFSERLATDMIERAGQLITGGSTGGKATIATVAADEEPALSLPTVVAPPVAPAPSEQVPQSASAAESARADSHGGADSSGGADSYGADGERARTSTTGG